MVDIFIIYLKRILFNKTIRIILCCIFIVSMYVTFVMASNAQTKSSIPIGVLNMDESKEGKQLLNRIKQIQAFSVYKESRENLDKLLKEDKILAVFIIKTGYEEAIKSGRVNKLVTLLYKENNSGVKILSDIFAGEMLKSISMYKSFLLYEAAVLNHKDQIKNNNSSYDTIEQYTAYVQDLEEGQDSFVFDVKTDKTKGSSVSTRFDNSLLYIQVLCGILTILISLLGLYIMLPHVMDREEGIRKRIRIGTVKNRGLFQLDLYTIGAGVSFLLCFNLVLCIGLCFSIPQLTLLHGAWLFILFLLYSVIVIPGGMIIGNIARKARTYEGIGIVVALIFGILGIGSMFAGFFNNDLLNISKLIPNSWFIKGFIDIIVNTGLQDIPYMQLFRLGFTGCGLICILCLLNKVKPD